MKMLQSIQVFVFSMVVMILVTSCSPEKIMPSGKGVWTYTNKTTTTIGSASSTTNTTTGDITFNDDNSGKLVESGGATSNFTWSYNGDAEEMTMTSGSSTVVYEVEESKPKSQIWKNESSSTIIGITTTVVQNVTLTKK